MLWANNSPVSGSRSTRSCSGNPPTVVMPVTAAGVAGLIDTGQKVLAVIRTASGGQAMYFADAADDRAGEVALKR